MISQLANSFVFGSDFSEVVKLENGFVKTSFTMEFVYVN